MHIMNTVKTVFGLAMLGAAQASQAGFIAIDNDLSAPDTSIAIVDNNDFKSPDLSGLGILDYRLGASLGVTDFGSVTFYYYGKEAGYSNEFQFGSQSFSTGATPTEQNYFAAPIDIGTMSVGPSGALDIGFCAYSGSWLAGCVSNADNDGLALFSPQSIAMHIDGNTAWLFWDDSGAGPDDNHDDMLIKAVFNNVPEPATLGLFGLGLLGVGFTARRKRI